MIIYGGKKYSVPVRYISHTALSKKWKNSLKSMVQANESLSTDSANSPIIIGQNTIVKSDVLSHFDKTELEDDVDENLQAYDHLFG